VRVLVGVPSLREGDRFSSYREDVLSCIKKALVGIEYVIFVTPPTILRDIPGIVDRENLLIDKCVGEGFDYLWIVQADVEVPINAFENLLGLGVDVALGVVPRHDDIGAFICGFMDEQKKVWYLPRQAIAGQIVSGWVFASGCILIKRRVLEAGIRFRCEQGVGEDILFAFDVQSSGFEAKVDGHVVCGHLPEWPLHSALGVMAPSYGLLDVGCGHRPKGDVNVDLYPEASAHRSADQRVNDDVALHVHEIPNFVKAKAQNLPFRDRAFRKLYSWHLIEHLPNPELFLEEATRVTNNTIIIFCPNGDPNWAYGREAYGETKPLHVYRLTREWFEEKLKAFPGWDWSVTFSNSQGDPWEIFVEGERRVLVG